MQTDGLRATVVEDRDGVAICDADHPATKLLCFSHPNEAKNDEQGEA
jgi:hypothetical protein